MDIIYPIVRINITLNASDQKHPITITHVVDIKEVFNKDCDILDTVDVDTLMDRATRGKAIKALKEAYEGFYRSFGLQVSKSTASQSDRMLTIKESEGEDE